MENFLELFQRSGFTNLSWGNWVMYAVASTLIYLAIVKKYEPLLLIPIGFGVLLANLPLGNMGSTVDIVAQLPENVRALIAGLPGNYPEEIKYLLKDAPFDFLTFERLKEIGTATAVSVDPLISALSELGRDFKPGVVELMYTVGIKTELLPPIIFMGVGVLTDFRPLLGRPLTFLLGAAAQLGIFVAALGAALLLDFNFKEAASIGIIGGADGPTSIFLTSQLAPHLLGPVAVAAYSYMSLVPVIQPPIIRMLTSKKERAIDMPQEIKVSKTAVIIFPIVTGILASLAIPSSAPLIGMLMFGNLLRECGVTERLRRTAGGSLINTVTIFLGLTVGATMDAEHFLTHRTVLILVLGAVAFSFSTAGGVAFAKFINLFLKKKINPCIGAAGVSAVPMSARVVQKLVSDETDGDVNPLMSAMGPNVAGVIGSAVAAGVFLTLLG